MKTRILLAMGFMASVCGYGQTDTYSAPGSAVSGSDYNVHLGFSVGPSSTGDQNVFAGYKAGFNNTVGYSNTFYGAFSGTANISSNGNVFIGYGSGESSISGANTYVGFRAGNSTVNGNFNSFYGYEAGRNATGSSNVFLGFQAGFNETGSSRLYISNSSTSSPLIYGEFDPDTDSSVEGTLKFNAHKVGIGFEASTMGFGAFPAMTGVTNAADYRLFVRGGILAEEVRIRLQSDWADYVFFPDYNLLPLKEVEKYIAENGHLPNMPSAAEVKEQGLEMGNIIKLQQEKIEELTLHLIRQEKEIEMLKENNKQLEELKAQVEGLLKKQ